MSNFPVSIIIIVLVLFCMAPPCSAGDAMGDDASILAEALFSAPPDGATAVSDPNLLGQADNWDSALLTVYPAITTKSALRGITHKTIDVLFRTHVVEGRNLMVRQSRFGWLLECNVPGLGGMTDQQIITVAKVQTGWALGTIEGGDKLHPNGRIGDVKCFRTPGSLPSDSGAKGGMVVLAAGDRLGLFLAKAHPTTGASGPQSGLSLSLEGNAGWFSGANDPPGKLVTP